MIAEGAGEFNEEAATLRDAALASSRTVTAQEDDCAKHAVNWRARTLHAEHVLGLWREYRFRCSDTPGADGALDNLLMGAEDATTALFSKLDKLKGKS